MSSSTWRQQGGEPEKPTAHCAVINDGSGWRAATILTNTVAQIDDGADTGGVKPPNAAISDDMSTMDRYIDARLTGIESKLDARMEAMQRFSEQADARMERQAKEAEARNRALIAEMKEDAKEAAQETRQASRRTVLNVWMAALTTILGAGAILLASVTAFQSSVSAVQGTVAEQGAWLRDSVNRIEQRIEAPPPPQPPAQPES